MIDSNLSIIDKQPYYFIIDRLVDKYIEQDRENNIFDLSQRRLKEHTQRAKRVYKTLKPKQIENSIKKIKNEIEEYRIKTVPSEIDSRFKNINKKG